MGERISIAAQSVKLALELLDVTEPFCVVTVFEDLKHLFELVIGPAKENCQLYAFDLKQAEQGPRYEGVEAGPQKINRPKGG
jgi:hypothetical protein